MAQLGDILAGAAGVPVNRPAINAAVMQGQAMAGLRSAQTEEALLNAQRNREEQAAGEQLETVLVGLQGSDGKPMLTPSQARAAATDMRFTHGGAKNALSAIQEAQAASANNTLGDPSQLNTPAATAASQVRSGHLAGPTAVPDTFAVPAGVTPPTIQQTPHGVAVTGEQEARARLANAQANDPHAFHPSMYGGGELPQELQTAVAEGRLDPAKLNGRNIGIWSQLAKGNPQFNFNRLMADAALQRNATFQQRAMTADAIPDILATMTAVGKKIGYSDFRTVGKMQQFMNGEFNDPDYTEYMAVRNDGLMNLASVMRGVGMSDQAHKAEIEAASPTLSPRALDAWLKGQTETLMPRLSRQHVVSGLGGPRTTPTPGVTPPAVTPPPGATTTGADPLGLLGGAK